MDWFRERSNKCTGGLVEFSDCIWNNGWMDWFRTINIIAKEVLGIEVSKNLVFPKMIIVLGESNSNWMVEVW